MRRVFALALLLLAPVHGSAQVRGSFNAPVLPSFNAAPAIDLPNFQGLSLDLDLQLEESALAANRDAVAPVELDGLEFHRWASADAQASQSTIYANDEADSVLKIFNSPRVERRHVKALVAMVRHMREAGVPVVPMDYVELPGERFGVRMPKIHGRDAQRVIEILNPDWMLTDPEAARMQRTMFSILKAIDRMTGGMSDRRVAGFDDGTGSFENFLYLEDKSLINVDPINIEYVVDWMNGAAIPESRGDGIFGEVETIDAPADEAEKTARERILSEVRALGWTEPAAVEAETVEPEQVPGPKGSSLKRFLEKLGLNGR